jgi:16S rRNA (uracil1498-N3)-methyltransferase
LVVAPEVLAGEEHRIAGDAFHHLVRVKRLEAGDALRLVDGAGRARFARLTSITQRDALARLGDEAPSNEPALAVELFVAPPKPERAAWLVEKATEVGVVAIRFLPTGRATRVFGAAQLERLRRIAIAAVEQCGRACIPTLSAAVSLDCVLGDLSRRAAPVLVLDAGGASPFSGALSSSTSEAPVHVAVLIGPEGGWTDEERARFVASGAALWSLGERALRVETAAIVAAGILLAG